MVNIGLEQFDISNFDTNISTVNYTVVVVGSAFDQPFLNNITANKYNTLNVRSYSLHGTWRFGEDYIGEASANNGTWTIYCLILNNSQVKTLSDVTVNLGGKNAGSVSAPSEL